MKNITTTVTLALVVFAANAQVTIPDANFKAALVGNSSINTNMNTEIEVSEATAYTGQIQVDNLNIADLTGIQAFTNVWMIDCKDNQLTSINVSSCAALQELHCQNNQLTALNVSSNTQLTHLFCDNNLITSLNLLSNPNLVRVECCMNQLTTLNLSNNPLVTTVSCCLNQLIYLDLSLQTGLTYINCSNNQLTYLNVANGNNTNIGTLPWAFDATNNNLGCIEVDDSTYSANNWVNIDPGAYFSLDCGSASIEDLQFENYFSFYPSPAVDFINVISTKQLDVENVYIINGIGETVLSLNKLNNRIDVSQFPSGVYFLQISTENKVFSKTFFIQR